MLDAVIIGAGPYGLSIAAHFQRRQIAFRIFGRPMDSWLTRMPKGMQLKSDGFASNISDPDDEFPLRKFCAERGIAYRDSGLPVSLETFTEYGAAFRERMIPALEDKLVDSVAKLPHGFLVRLEDGETVEARRVILAVGITHFEFVPAVLDHLAPEAVSHSNRHNDLESFRGRNVVVLGGGASALELAGLLKESGAAVQIVARTENLRFHSTPTGTPRSLWQRFRHPQSGLGPGLRSRFFADSPLAFFYLPEKFRLWNVRRALGPSGGWFVKDMVIGKVPCLLGQSIERAEMQKGAVVLHLRSADGSTRELLTDHVIAATGYKVDMRRLAFLSDPIRSTVRALDGSPVLSSSFESSVPGLYFIGIAAANSFGPVMRFAFGARFAAEHVTRRIARSLSRERAPVHAASLVANPK